MNLEEGQEKTQPKKRKRNVNNNNNNNNNKNGIVNRLCQTCANCCRLKSKYLRVIIIIQVILLLFFSTLYMKGYHKDAWMYFSYYTRPLWDTAATPPFTVIEHFYAEDVPIEALCQVNGWTYAGQNTTHKLVDAVIFSNELDLLEIRWKELLPVVDYFFIVESDKTFTNKPKAKTFAENRERFAFAKDKIIYDLFEAPAVTEDEARRGFPLEGMLRDFMTDLLKKHLVKRDRVMMTDVDELPSRDTAKLLKYCDGYPSSMHLGLKNYIYSFEFPITHQAGYIVNSPGSYHWRAQVHEWNYPGTFYRHGQSSQYLLADSGWHCTFCFRYLEDFVFKMTSYSHSDRVRHSDFLNHDRIQKIVCKGTDIFGMPAESYTWYDVLLNLYAPPKTESAVHLPVQIVEHPELYPFLLPGNCIRQKHP